MVNHYLVVKMMTDMKTDSSVWHPNTQMSEWKNFPEIVSAKGMWLYDSKGGKMLDGVASMWCLLLNLSINVIMTSTIIIIIIIMSSIITVICDM